MIVFSHIGKKGNLGNQLFQIASTIGIAKKNGHTFLFPYWVYSNFFEFPIPMGKIDANDYELLEYKKFEYCSKKIGEGNYDIRGWLQTEKYFNIPMTRHYFTFKKSIRNKLLEKYAFLFTKHTILITIRRGDFVKNPKFYQLPYKYYFLAILKFFPKWEKSILVFMSDDINYCKKHFKSLNNAFFIDSISPMEQLILGSNCDDFIISNSTFSWWVAWLGEKKTSKIICPIRNFSKKYTLENDKDFYPDRWLKFDYKNISIPNKYYKIIFIGELYEYWKSFKYRLRKIGFVSKIITRLKN